MHSTLRSLVSVAVVATLASSLAAAMTVEEVVARHIEAKGGRDAWDAVRSMRVTGTYAAFSVSSPFTLIKQRDDRYHIDTTMNERPVIIGHDGETLWWENGFFGEGAKVVEGADRAALVRELDFATPFFDLERAGHSVALLDDSEYEGLPAVAVELTRADDSKETWYLDAETYLEMARLSPGSDFGRPMEQRTFFDDFREVDGVRIPFYQETQWYTRNRIMRIEAIETNVAVDEVVFAMPAPPGMREVLPIAGTWQVAVFRRNSPQGEFEESAREATIEAAMGRALLREEFAVEGAEIARTLSFDRYADTYRMTEFSTSTGHMDVLEGSFDGDGKLVVSNVATGTSFGMFGQKIHSRVSFVDIDGDGFEMHTEVAVGEEPANWWVAVKEVYTPAATE